MDLRRWLIELLRRRKYFRAGYLGFDRNLYPGTENLALLRQTFHYSSFWLNAPPGLTGTNWLGNRKNIEDAGFGFIVLYNATDVEANDFAEDSFEKGKADAKDAISKARSGAFPETFPDGTIIFLDIERGGAMTPKQMSYLTSWCDTIATMSTYRAGIYCSGIRDEEGIVTAQYIKENIGKKDITFWVYNDICPPSIGCKFPKVGVPSPTGWSKTRPKFINDVWQFAQTPKRKKGCSSQDFAKDCSGYFNEFGVVDPNGCFCYPPGFEDGTRTDSIGEKMVVDINTATSTDPSHGRRTYYIAAKGFRSFTSSVVILAATAAAIWFYSKSKSSKENA